MSACGLFVLYLWSMGRATGKGTSAIALRRRVSAAPVAVPAERIDDGRGLPMIFSNAPEEVLNDFTGGFCHFLAMELHARHGWQMRALGPPADEYSSRPWRGLGFPTHIYCLNDRGLPVDGNGVFADEAAIQRFYTNKHNPDEELSSVDVSRADFDEATRDGDTLVEHGYRLPYDVEVGILRERTDKLALHTL